MDQAVPGFWSARAAEYATSDMARDAELDNTHRGHDTKALLDLFGICEECFLRRLRGSLRAPLTSHFRRHAERIADIIADMGVRPLKGSTNRYIVPSMSRRGIYYTVTVHGDRAVCTCRGSALDYFGRDGWHSGRCYHAVEVLNLVTSMNAVVPYEAQQALVPLAVRPTQQLLPSPDEMRVLEAICRAAPYAAGKFLPKELNDPGSCMMVALAGWSLGLPPIIAFQHIYIIEGRLMPSAQALMGVIRANVPGVDFEWLQFDQAGCRVLISAPGRRSVTAEYMEADALRAGQLRKGRGEDGKALDVVMAGEKRSTAWNTHRPLMFAYNAVRTAMKLEYVDVMLQVAPRLGMAPSEGKLLSAPPETAALEGVRDDDLADLDFEEIPWNDKRDGFRDQAAFIASLAKGMKKHGTTRSQLVGFLDGATFGQWFRDHPTASIDDLPREASTYVGSGAALRPDLEGVGEEQEDGGE